MNDSHAQVYFILKHSGFTKLQRQGFQWNIHYQGKVFPVTFRMYVPFIVRDTEGHDQLCGHYKCRTGNVAQLCRACVCPTKLCGWSKAKFRYRTSEKVNRLIATQDMDQLKAMSQHFLQSGFRDIEFGSSHNKRGIFGACPGETSLHLVLLGWFKYVIEAFVAQAGAKSQTIRMYNTLCSEVGNRLGRQSDQDMPRTLSKWFLFQFQLHGQRNARLSSCDAIHISYIQVQGDVFNSIQVQEQNGTWQHSTHNRLDNSHNIPSPVACMAQTG